MNKVFAFMNSYSQGSSGSDIVFIEVAKRIKDYEFVVITSELGEKLCRENDLNASFFITTKEKSFYNVYKIYFKRIFFGLLKKLQVKPGDVFLGTSDFFPDVLPILKNKLLYKNNIWVQSIYHLIPKNRFVAHYSQKISIKLIKRFCDEVITDNSGLRNELIKLGIPEHKLHLVYLGIREFKVIPSSEKFEASYMSRIKEFKGVYDAVDIWKKVTEKIPDARLAVIGKGDEYSYIQLSNYIFERGLTENIKLMGYLENEQAFSVIAGSKVFLFPSHEEGFGLVGLEAQILGVPVVAWNLEVFDEVFPLGMTKIQMSEIKKFSDEVVKIISNKEYHSKLSRDSLENVKSYSWQKTADKIKSFFI